MSDANRAQPRSNSFHSVPEEHGTGEIPREIRIKRIRAACRQARSQASLRKELKLSRGTLCRDLKFMVRQGFLKRVGKLYEAVGSEPPIVSKEVEVEPEPERKLDLAFPVLPFLPVEEYRAMGELIYFARIAREYDLNPGHHPGFLFFGLTQRSKSTSIGMICVGFGAKVEECRAHTPQTRTRGSLARLNGEGKLRSVSGVLSQPIAWFDEVSMSDRKIEKDLFTITHGDKTVYVEQNAVEVLAVPVFEMNDRKEKGKPGERTGMAPQQFRRFFAICVDKLLITPEMHARAHENLAELREMKAPALPGPPQGKLPPDLWRRVLRVLAACVEEGSLQLIDNGRVLTVILGARAVLDDLAACRRVLRNVFITGRTTGLIKDGWEAVLTGEFGPESPNTREAAPGSNAKATPPETSRRMSESEILERILKARGKDGSANRYTKEGVEAHAAKVITRHSVRLPDDLPFLDTALAAARSLSGQGYSLADIPAMFTRLNQFEQYVAGLYQRGIDDAKLQQLLELSDALTARGISREQVEPFLSWGLKLCDRGFSPQVVEWFMKGYRERIEHGMDGEAAVQDWMTLASEHLDIRFTVQCCQNQVEELEEQARDLEKKIKRLQGECEALESLEKVQFELNEVLEQSEKRTAQRIERLRDEERVLKARLEA